MTAKYVGSSGPRDADVMLLSQGPGRAEGQIGKPFVGPSGEQQQMYLSFFGLDQRQFYLSNLMKLWRPEDPTPSATDLDKWGPAVQKEIDNVNPRIIGAVGSVAAKWLLKPHYPHHNLSMDLIHGLAFPLPGNRTAIAIEHPASGLHSPEQKPRIFYDYEQLATAITDSSQCRYDHLQDSYAGNETYCRIDGYELVKLFNRNKLDIERLSIDTEGNKRYKRPESIQFSSYPGTGYTMWVDSPGFDIGIGHVQALLDSNPRKNLIIVHNALFDVPMSRLMGPELQCANIDDTMYGLFVLGGFERLGLDTSGYRFCGARTDHFMNVVGSAARQRQIQYIEQASRITWWKPAKQDYRKNDGSIKRQYGPQGMNTRLDKILTDLENDEKDIDIEDRFYKKLGSEEYQKDITNRMVKEVEDTLGPFPTPSLRDIPEDEAIYYECRDADIPVRLHDKLLPFLHKHKVYDTFKAGMRSLPAVEECQETGIPACLQYFVNLKEQFQNEAFEYQEKISLHEGIFNGKPFNPKSSKQRVQLIESLGETGLEKTPTGQVSTGENSIMHLQSKHEAVRWLFKASHLKTLANNFCNSVIARCDPNKDITFIQADWIYTGPPTRRLATSGKSRKSETGFNLLGQPSRGKESLLFRQGYQCPPGYVFVGADLSQIEPRVLAHLSQDPNLLDIYNNDRDWYIETAAIMQQQPREDIDPLTRFRYKTFNLGLMYGYGGFQMLKQFFKAEVFTLPLSVLPNPEDYRSEMTIDGTEFKVTETVCSAMIDYWYYLHKGVSEFKSRLAEEVWQTGIVRDASGMPRRVPDIRSFDKRDRSQAERWIVSHVVQGTAQTAIQNSMAALVRKFQELRQQGVDVRLSMQYHDDLTAITRKEFAPMIGAMIVWAMTTQTGLELSVPVRAECKISDNWAGLK